MNDKALLRAEGVARLLGIGRSKAYEMIDRGELPSLRIGRLVRVPRHALDRWIAEHKEVEGGRLSIQKLGPGRYRVWLFLGRDANGKQLRRSEVVKGTKADAEKRERSSGGRSTPGRSWTRRPGPWPSS